MLLLAVVLICCICSLLTYSCPCSCSMLGVTIWHLRHTAAHIHRLTSHDASPQIVSSALLVSKAAILHTRAGITVQNKAEWSKSRGSAGRKFPSGVHGSGGTSTVKEPGHFKVRKSSNQVTRVHFFSQKSRRPLFSCRPQNTGRQCPFTVKIKQIKRSDMVTF